MNNEIRISVVLAACNGSAYIAEQLHSLLESLGENDEIVIADDASTDGTIEVLKGVHDRRIKVLQFSERVGYQRNFERAIAASTGRYVFFSDQDDLCLPERIPLSLEALRHHALVCGDAVIADADLKPRSPSYFSYRGARSFSVFEMVAKPPVIGATMACRREFLADKLPFPAGLPHDQWLTLTAAAQGELGVVHRPFILYRRHAAVATPSGVTGGKKRALLRIVWERVRLGAIFLRWYFMLRDRTAQA